MKTVIFSSVVLILMSGTSQAQDITNKIQEMNKFSNQEQARQEKQQYQQYLKNNDSANGVSQRTGPTGSVSKDGGTAGYQWSTK